ncbi:MAG: hypothetical protein COA99_14165 [Moraxellaceae bacterium]|nr:MAG: hypothetical protein COA99_14165 [Moraxellaceae bacterium]
MKTDLINLQPEIDKKEEETNEMVKTLIAQKKVASETEKRSAVETEESQKLFDHVKEIQDECEKDLSECMPIV